MNSNPSIGLDVFYRSYRHLSINNDPENYTSIRYHVRITWSSASYVVRFVLSSYPIIVRSHSLPSSSHVLYSCSRVISSSCRHYPSFQHISIRYQSSLYFSSTLVFDIKKRIIHKWVYSSLQTLIILRDDSRYYLPSILRINGYLSSNFIIHDSSSLNSIPNP